MSTPHNGEEATATRGSPVLPTDHANVTTERGPGSAVSRRPR